MTDEHQCVQELFGAWEPPEQPFYDLAMDYHRRTEAYDRRVCSRRVKGIAMPGSDRELSLINRHARCLIEYMVDKHSPGTTYSPRDFQLRLKEMILATGPLFARDLRAGLVNLT